MLVIYNYYLGSNASVNSVYCIRGKQNYICGFKNVLQKHAYLCITPPALRDAEYLQSPPGTLGCKKREGEELSLRTSENQYCLVNK